MTDGALTSTASGCILGQRGTLSYAVSPHGQFKQWIECTIAKPIKDKGFKFLYHTDGKAEKILPIVVNELGADGFNPIERNGCNDIFEIRRHYPRTLLFRNVCCETTLPYGTPMEVE